jgi:hypothetical protein
MTLYKHIKEYQQQNNNNTNKSIPSEIAYRGVFQNGLATIKATVYRPALIGYCAGRDIGMYEEIIRLSIRNVHKDNKIILYGHYRRLGDKFPKINTINDIMYWYFVINDHNNKSIGMTTYLRYYCIYNYKTNILVDYSNFNEYYPIICDFIDKIPNNIHDIDCNELCILISSEVSVFSVLSINDLCNIIKIIRTDNSRDIVINNTAFLLSDNDYTIYIYIINLLHESVFSQIISMRSVWGPPESVIDDASTPPASDSEEDDTDL